MNNNLYSTESHAERTNSDEGGGTMDGADTVPIFGTLTVSSL